MKDIDQFSQIIKDAVKAAIPGLLPEYYSSHDFVCQAGTLWRLPAVARVYINIENSYGFASHDFTPEQMQRMANKLEEETGVKADLVRIAGNRLTAYWLDYNAFAIGELMRCDTPNSFAYLIKHRDELIGRRIELSASLITSYLLYLEDERLTGVMQFTITDIERAKDGLVYLRLTPTDERVVIEDNYHGDHHSQAGFSGCPYDLLDFRLVEE